MPVIVVQGVSKKYSRNADRHLGYGFSDLFKEIFNRRSSLALRRDEFMAVDDVSFYLNRGDSLALIGRNGSGKTTLLKMMNGLVKMDSGRIVVDGRVQALINLGAGFSPNISGKDNIYNSASLMGLNSREALTIIDEVIEFSELEEFIDSPVGTYSSGMRARLAFSVAINLTPDVFFIDEVLAVGDHGFRNKCFIKLHELRKAGTTIILVSHAHTHVVQLCDQALWLDRGRMMRMGPSKEVVQAYLDFLDVHEVERLHRLNVLKQESLESIENKVEPGVRDSLYGPIYSDVDRVEDVSVSFLVNGKETDTLRVHDELSIEYGFKLKGKVTDLNVTLSFMTKDGTKINALSTLNGDLLKDVHEGVVRCRIVIKDFNINPGVYVLVLPIHEGKSYLYRDVVKEFVVRSCDRLTWEVVDFRYDFEVIEPKPNSKRASFL